MVIFARNFASKLPSKLLLAAFFLCLGACAGVTQKPNADVFALIQKLQTMHPLTIEKLQNEGFVVTSQKKSGVHLVTFGTAPTLADRTPFQDFYFSVLAEDPSRTFLVIEIANICITYEDLKEVYPEHITRTDVTRIHSLLENETKLLFIFPIEYSGCMEYVYINNNF